MVYKINGKKFFSIKKPKMYHVRMGGKMMALSEQEDFNLFKYIETMCEYIKETFPDMTDEDINNIEQDKFMPLIKKISEWTATGGNTQKKTNTQG